MVKYAIIVTYEPDVRNLGRICNSISNQGFAIVIVDNSEKNHLTQSHFYTPIEIINNHTNLGIAKAQNLGVKYAESKQAEILVFFDQDSMVPCDLLLRLESALCTLNNSVVCPMSVDEKTNDEYPSHRITKFGYMKDVYAKNSEQLVNVDIVISSGTMTTMETFKKIGYFDEDFFIDFVDIEWCLRGKKCNVNFYIVPNTWMQHIIGDNNIKIGTMTIVRHSPIRTYYKVRNCILLFRKNIHPLFVLRQIIPAIIHNLVLCFSVESKKDYFFYYFIGIIHGILGKRGKYTKTF